MRRPALRLKTRAKGQEPTGLLYGWRQEPSRCEGGRHVDRWFLLADLLPVFFIHHKVSHHNFPRHKFHQRGVFTIEFQSASAIRKFHILWINQFQIFCKLKLFWDVSQLSGSGGMVWWQASNYFMLNIFNHVNCCYCCCFCCWCIMWPTTYYTDFITLPSEAGGVLHLLLPHWHHLHLHLHHHHHNHHHHHQKKKKKCHAKKRDLILIVRRHIFQMYKSLL